uniref:Cell division protein FtsZ n=1 Tax=gamma proteobacterium symbiont of Robbea hypermnestra TaxID=1843434 RepID=A0A168S2J0_9GAMM|nr:FtsZ [gamma proteobacterium symbiont of Robbea hypermnestra]
MFELMDTNGQDAVIKVIGVGGGGGNAVNQMVDSAIEGVDFICANTDSQALKHSNAKTILQLGADITKGLGAGADPKVGQEAALEDRERIHDALEGADMVFITAGMGGGTGTGAAPIVAQIARELGILTVAVVTKPFAFEGAKRMQVALEGISELANHVDSLITIPNEKLLAVLGKEMSLLNAFKAANDVLLNATQGIAELITCPGLINVDFADIKTVMAEMGQAMMGTGAASGEQRARDAAEAAINSPLLEDIDLAGAKGILVNITAGMSLSIGEFDEVGNTVRDFADDDATVVVGTVIDSNLSEELRVTVVATGLGKRNKAQPRLAVGEPALHLVSNGITETATPDYRELDRPAVYRNKGHQGGTAAAATQAQADTAGEKNLDYLDIPAFLRRQAN